MPAVSKIQPAVRSALGSQLSQIQAKYQDDYVRCFSVAIHDHASASGVSKFVKDHNKNDVKGAMGSAGAAKSEIESCLKKAGVPGA